MEENREHKNTFIIKRIEVEKSVTIQKDKRWIRQGLKEIAETTCNTLESLCAIENDLFRHVGDSLDKQLEKTTKHTAEDPLPRTHIGPFDINEIAWHPSVSKQTGQPFERSVDRENPHFQSCIDLLINEGRSRVIDEYFVWVFKDNRTLGRKPARGQ